MGADEHNEEHDGEKPTPPLTSLQVLASHLQTWVMQDGGPEVDDEPEVTILTILRLLCAGHTDRAMAYAITGDVNGDVDAAKKRRTNRTMSSASSAASNSACSQGQRSFASSAHAANYVNSNRNNPALAAQGFSFDPSGTSMGRGGVAEADDDPQNDRLQIIASLIEACTQGEESAAARVRVEQNWPEIEQSILLQIQRLWYPFTNTNNSTAVGYKNNNTRQLRV